MITEDRIRLISFCGLTACWHGIPGKEIVWTCDLCGHKLAYANRQTPGMSEHELIHFNQIPRAVWDRMSSAVAMGATWEAVRREFCGFPNPAAALKFFRSGKALAP